MPATMVTDPVGIACVFSDASTARFALDGLPCPDLVGDLLVGLVELIHPHGAVDAAGSVNHYVQSIRDMARKLAGRGFTGRVADLRRPLLAQYWMAATGPREACTRRLLRGFHAAGGQLDAQVLELAAGRAYNPQRNHRQLPPYREAEWARLTAACRTIADEAFTGHKQALAAAERGRHPNEGGWSADNLRWLLVRVGPFAAAGFGQQLGCSEHVVRNRSGFLDASRDLFPVSDVVIAYRLLFGIYSGIVPDGIDDLLTDDIDWAGDATILLSYVKGRTAAESLTLPRRAARLLQQWLAHSALLRSHGGPTERRRLWLGIGRPGGTRVLVTTGAAGRVAIQRWVIRHGVAGDDGVPGAGLGRVGRRRFGGCCRVALGRRYRRDAQLLARVDDERVGEVVDGRHLLGDDAEAIGQADERVTGGNGVAVATRRHDLELLPGGKAVGAGQTVDRGEALLADAETCGKRRKRVARNNGVDQGR